MATVPNIVTLNIDDTSYEVSDLSESVQQLVALFNEWNQEEQDRRSAFLMVSAAKENLSSQIVAAVRADLAAAEEANGDVVEDGVIVESSPTDVE
jgi:hypothetical protein